MFSFELNYFFFVKDSQILLKTEPNEVDFLAQNEYLNETDSNQAKSTSFSQTSKPKAVNF